MNEEKLHALLPIGSKEKILTTIRHHWFAYVSVYLGAGFLCLVIIGILISIGTMNESLGFSAGAMTAITAIGLMFVAIVAAFSFIPVWIKKQEMLVLTEEAVLQVRKPSLLASKVSQLNLQHVADVTVNQNTLGTLLGFAHLTIETPGEQDNFEFFVAADAREKAKMIIEAHENYVAALESGQIQTSLGERPPTPGAAWRREAPTPQTSNEFEGDMSESVKNWTKQPTQTYKQSSGALGQIAVDAEEDSDQQK